MIVIDSNVISELMRPVPSRSVADWVDSQRGACTTAVTQAEILYGLELLPAGKRREAFLVTVNQMFQRLFGDRILPFDSEAALVFPVITAERRRRGRPISDFDAAIASITRAHGATLATRNTKDFVGCGIEVINPWVQV